MADPSGVDKAHRTFVSYIDKSREYYLAQGFANPYSWAYFDEVAFTPLRKPVAASRLTLITTASEVRDAGAGPRLRKRVFSMPSDSPPERLYTADLEWDKEATHTEDLDSFFPVHRLQELVREGKVGSLASGMPNLF